jgi:hypothetical protein
MGMGNYLYMMPFVSALNSLYDLTSNSSYPVALPETIFLFSGTVGNHVKWNKPGLDRQRLHDFLNVWKTDLKDKHTPINKYDRIHIHMPNMFVIAKLLWSTGGGRKKRMIESQQYWNALHVQVEDITIFTESCWLMGSGREWLRENNSGGVDLNK